MKRRASRQAHIFRPASPRIFWATRFTWAADLLRSQVFKTHFLFSTTPGGYVEGFSQKDFADAIGISESSVQRWAERGRLRIVTTTRGESRILRDEAMRYLRKHKTILMRPDRIGLPADLTGFKKDWASLDIASGQLQADVIEGRYDGARAVLFGLFLAGHSAATVIERVVRPEVARLETLRRGTSDHRRTALEARDLLARALKEFRGLLGGSGRRISVGGATEGGAGILPSLQLACVVTSRGWQTMDMGARTPPRLVAQAVSTYNARFAWMELDAAPSERTVSEFVHLAQMMRDKGGFLAVHGAVDALRDVVKGDHVALATSLIELDEAISDWQPADDEPARRRGSDRR